MVGVRDVICCVAAEFSVEASWNFPRLAGDLFGAFDATDSAASPSTAAAPDVFEREYSCYPVSFANREELERGNKILLPQSALSTLARMNVTWPMLFSLSNAELQRRTHGGVLEFSAAEGLCYMPYWMMKNLVLSEGGKVQIRNISLPKGTYVKLQPVTSDFLDISDHRAVLEHALCFFAALTAGDNIVIQHNDRNYEIEIVECRPAPAVSIIETDIQVDFVPPKDYVQPVESENVSGFDVPETATAPSASSAKDPDATTAEQSSSQFTLFGGTGRRLGVDHDNGYCSKSPTLSSSSQAASSGVAKHKENGQVTQDTQALGIPGGVRTSCSEYTQLLQSGRLPGIVGKARSAVAPQTPKKKTPEDKTTGRFQLFGGEGRTC